MRAGLLPPLVLEELRAIVGEKGMILDDQGSGYADVHARMPAAMALAVASLVGAAMAVAAAVTRRSRCPTWWQKW